MEPKTKIESKVVYDDRRKEMVQNFKQENEIMEGEEVVGHSVMTRNTKFTEEGIRKTLKMLSDQRTQFERKIKQINENLKSAPKMTKELKNLEKQIQLINEINKNNQMISQLDAQKKDLKIVVNDIRDIKDAIGSRLKI